MYAENGDDPEIARLLQLALNPVRITELEATSSLAASKKYRYGPEQAFDGNRKTILYFLVQ